MGSLFGPSWKIGAVGGGVNGVVEREMGVGMAVVGRWMERGMGTGMGRVRGRAKAEDLGGGVGKDLGVR